ncbi:MAG UNVERIFIED_CONTAM: alkene reductase [Planctomycetaceae bacterium]|jgi:2,4-dienoyl-CoA reductase-like NADH-dependent reductase (Old Yellow Enzyme family)
MAEYYGQRASAGLLIAEATVVTPDGVGFADTPGIYSQEMSDAWRLSVDAVHHRGHILSAALALRSCITQCIFDGRLPVAPSAVAIRGDGIHTPKGKQPYESPRALQTEEIPSIVDQYRKGAQFAKAAGFDGVEIHAANGYLIDQFLQSRTNRRTDQYGGSIENRYRFLREIVDAIATVYPSHRIGVRLSPNGVFNDMGSDDFRQQFHHAAAQLNQAGIGYLHVIDGLAFGFHQLGDSVTLQETRQLFPGTLIGNCGYTAESADAAVARGDADLIAFGRPFISNPDLVERFDRDAPLNPDAGMDVWYAPIGARGYTDFPTLQSSPDP